MGHFKRQADDSLSRANSLRPLHRTLRLYYVASGVFFASVAIIAILNSAEIIQRRGTSYMAFAHAVLGIGSLLFVLLASIRLGADCLRRWALDGMSRQAIRKRLASQPREFRYEAKPGQLRGMIIGAVVFGIFAVFAIVVRFTGLAP